MPHMNMTHEEDPRELILQALGDIEKFKVFHNEVVVAVYLRPEKTKSGIYLPDQHRDEDRHQSKVGLVVKMGSEAFDDPNGNWFRGMDVKLHDWVVYRPSDGWTITVNNVLCRALKDTNIRGSVPHPDMIW
jgi:co-chaperonin GroES (HSP10)